MRPSRIGVIGIMVSESKGPFPFTEPSYSRKLCQIGNKQGLQIYVFSPSSVRAERDMIAGFSYENGSWMRRLFPPPDILYDRYFFYDRKSQLRKQNALSMLSAKHPFIYLTRGLTGKWSVYQTLLKYDEIAPHLPETSIYTSHDQLSQWIADHDNQVFLKPQNGTHGKNTMHVKVTNGRDHLRIIGRDSNNNIFRKQFASRHGGYHWIDKFTGHRPFLLQPYLNLNNTHDQPFDIRVLIQKNSNGMWEITGRAARVGHKYSLTSNLHGGGNPQKAVPFLIREFGDTNGESIVATMDQLSTIIPIHLESHFGRLAELGIDFGVDHQGKVWILEVNSKPGRSSFFKIGDVISARKSIENPIGYARYLLLNKP